MRVFLTVLVLLWAASCASEEGGISAVKPEVEGFAAEGWTVKSIPELAAALRGGEVRSVGLTQAYLDRIASVDRAGPRLQSVLTLNPDAMAQARASDQRRAEGGTLGPLDGLPIVVKDNIETADPMATTAGSLALKDNITGRDSPVVANLRAGGAVILGKTNLSQWANFRSNDSVSGWSSLGGQVRNPHMLDRSPCGSSSGSGAAVAASLAAGAIGTETNGSIICPAHVNGVVGFKPSVGWLSQEFIVPISVSQDTAGPMTKTVLGAAMMFEQMLTGTGRVGRAATLSVDGLRGKRMGVMRFAQGENDDILLRFEAALQVMRDQGAILVEIERFAPADGAFWADALAVLEYEFKDGLNAYLSGLPGDPVAASLAELIAFNSEQTDVELALFGQDIFIAAQARGALSDPDYIRARDAIQTATREAGIDALLATYELDGLVAPSGPISARVDPVNGDVWPAWAGAGWMAAIAGYPHLTVPMGEVHAIPLGVSFIGGKDRDFEVLTFGYAYEQASLRRVEPQYLASAEARAEIAAAMTKGE